MSDAVEVKKLAAQGDVLFRKTDKIPASFAKKETKGPKVVAHSETGHDHIVPNKGVELFEDPKDPMVCYLKLDIGVPHADVVHKRDYDTHKTLRLKGDGDSTTIFEVRRQQEYTPEGWRRVED